MIDGNDNTFTIYGKWVSFLKFTYSEWFKEKVQTIEILKGNSLTSAIPDNNFKSSYYRKTSGVGPSTINLCTYYSSSECGKYEWDKTYLPY